jgi:hypothetical protein
MRWFLLIAALLGLTGTAVAREPLARPMERTPSIMTGGDETPRVSRTVKRHQATRQQNRRSARAQASRARSVAVPRASAVYEAQTGSINRSISQQQQLQQLEQRRQVDNNLLRQDILRSTPSRVCAPGQIGC